MQTASRFGWGVHHVVQPSLAWVATFYVVWVAGAVAGSFRPTWRIPTRWWGLLWVVWITVAVQGRSLSSFIARWSASPPPLVCHFLRVGHGTSVLFTTRFGESFLYDAGSLGGAAWRARQVAARIRQEGVARLEAVFISHADADHFSLLPYLLDRISIGQVFVPPHVVTHQGTQIASLRRRLASARVPVRVLVRGHRLELREVTLNVLHPSGARRGGETDNARSLVLLVSVRGSQVLLPGDIEGPGLARLFSESVDVDIVMLPHHGSQMSMPEAFVDWSQAETVVISGELTPSNAEVARRMRVLGMTVYHTGEPGVVSLTVGDDSLAR